MKKTLALLLALLMILSVALVSCGDEEETLPETDDPFEGFDVPGVNNGSGSANNGTGGSGSSASGFNPIATENATAYALMSVKVRSNAKKSAATNGSVKYGSSVTRVEANGTWTKIKYTDGNGATKEGYVYNEVLTTDVGRVTYVAKETAEKATVKENNVVVRQVPWTGKDASGDVLYNTEIPQILNGANGIANSKFQLTKDQEVEILGATQSSDGVATWSWIKYTVEGTEVYGYCRSDFLTVAGQAETPVTPVNPSLPGVPDPV